MDTPGTSQEKLNLFNKLPVEIFNHILINLEGEYVFRCRAVCHHWKAVVDNLLDSDWRIICKNSRFAREYEEAYKKTKTPMLWRDLYKSFHIWPQIKSTEIKTQVATPKDIVNFKILPNGIISGLQSNQLPDEVMYTVNNVIVYIDLETLQECDRIVLDVFVSSYDENEYLIVLLHHNLLWIMPKVNRKLFYVGGLSMCGYGVLEGVTLVQNRVYFRNVGSNICVAYLEEEKAEVGVKTKTLEAFTDSSVTFKEIILGFSPDKFHRSDKQIIIILTDKGNIYRHINKQFEKLYTLEGRNTASMLKEMDYYGFDCVDPLIFTWLTATFSHNAIFSKLKNSCVCKQGSIFIVTFSRSQSMRIYNAIHNRDLHITTAKLIKLINLKKLFKTSCCFNDIQQIDVVETAHSHKILVLASDQLHVIDFIHTQLSPDDKKGNNSTMPTFKCMLRSKVKFAKIFKTGKRDKTK